MKWWKGGKLYKKDEYIIHFFHDKHTMFSIRKSTGQKGIFCIWTVFGQIDSFADVLLLSANLNFSIMVFLFAI